MTFIFTRCPVPEFCPVMISRFKQLQSAIERDPTLAQTAQLLSVTLDPEFDTPEVLRAYRRAVGAQPARWKFAGGPSEDVRRVSRAFSVHVEKNGALLDHTLTTALIGADGQIIEIWRGNGWTAEEILSALRAHGRP
jgi:protein SCO1/2